MFLLSSPLLSSIAWAGLCDSGTVEVVPTAVGTGTRGAAALWWTSYGTSTINVKVTNTGSVPCSYFVQLTGMRQQQPKSPWIDIKGNRPDGSISPGGFPGDDDWSGPVLWSDSGIFEIVQPMPPGSAQVVSFDIRVNVFGPEKIFDMAWVNPNAQGFYDSAEEGGLWSNGHEPQEDVCVTPQYEVPIGTDQWGQGEYETAALYRGKMSPYWLRYTLPNVVYERWREAGPSSPGADTCNALPGVVTCPEFNQVTGGIWHMFPNSNADYRDQWGYKGFSTPQYPLSYDAVGYKKDCVEEYFDLLPAFESCGTSFVQEVEWNCRDPSGKSSSPNWWVQFTSQTLSVELKRGAGVVPNQIKVYRGAELSVRDW